MDRLAGHDSQMRSTVLVIPMAILVMTGAGAAICVASGANPHMREMLVAAAGCLLASELAILPLLLTRGASQPAVAQASLAGTVIHLLGCAALAATVIILKIGRLDAAVLYWLLAFYWTTLIALVSCFVRAVKAAPVATPQRQA